MFDRLARRLWPLAAVAAVLAGIAWLSMTADLASHQLPVRPASAPVAPTPAVGIPAGGVAIRPRFQADHLPVLADAVVVALGMVVAVGLLGGRSCS